MGLSLIMNSSQPFGEAHGEAEGFWYAQSSFSEALGQGLGSDGCHFGTSMKE